MKEYQVNVYANRTEWFLNGKRHREDGPAVEYTNGHKQWRRNGNLHREDGPAVEYADGSKRWYLNGNLHREDGPAIECANGSKEWWRNGKRLSEEDWKKEVAKFKCPCPCSPVENKVIIIDGKQYKLVDMSS
jgi:hypothetical protein